MQAAENTLFEEWLRDIGIDVIHTTAFVLDNETAITRGFPCQFECDADISFFQLRQIAEKFRTEDIRLTVEENFVIEVEIYGYTTPAEWKTT